MSGYLRKYFGVKKSPSPNKQFHHISNQNHFKIVPKNFEDASFHICKGEFWGSEIILRNVRITCT